MLLIAVWRTRKRRMGLLHQEPDVDRRADVDLSLHRRQLAILGIDLHADDVAAVLIASNQEATVGRDAKTTGSLTACGEILGQT